LKRAVILSVLAIVSAAFASDQTCVLKVSGMTCNGCAGKIKSALEKVEGVKSAEVSLASGSASVVYDNTVVGRDKMIKAITDLGYKAAEEAVAPGTVTHLECVSHKGDKPIEAGVEKNAPKIVISGAESGKPIAGEMSESAEKPMDAVTTATVEKGESAEHHCATLKACKELNEFHEAMHPLAMAIGFEGDEEKDYEFVRQNYPELKAKAKALSKMKIDDRLVTDRKVFEKKRKDLIKAVDDFGAAIRKNDQAMMDRTFEVVHQAYIDLAMLSK